MTTFTRQDVVAQARSWLGTPYQHQARCKGAGVDCAGLIIGVAHALGASLFDTTAYGRQPLGAKLLEILQANARPAGHAWLPGQIVLMRFASEPQHLGILAPSVPGAWLDQLHLIHAYGHSGRVVEHRLSSLWQHRVLARFEFPGVTSSPQNGGGN